jgi:hypothetical protein
LLHPAARSTRHSLYTNAIVLLKKNNTAARVSLELNALGAAVRAA